MALDRTPTRRDATLSPARWSRPGAGSMLRWLLVAALLTLALGALYLREPTSSCPPPSASLAGGGITPSRSTGPPAGTGPAGPTGASPAAGTGSAAHPGGSPGGPGGPGGSAAPSGVPVPEGTVGVPIRLAEPAALTVARPGARVDLLAAPGGDQTGRAAKPSVLATRVLVLDVLGPGQTDGAASAIYLALRPEQAHRAVGMPESTRFAIIVRS